MSELSPAYLKLVDLASRSHKNADELPAQTEAVTYWTGVGFTLDGNQYVASMDEISEILSVPRFTQVPGVQTWVRGISNIRGRLMPVMDLLTFLNKKSEIQWKRRRLLVIESGELYSGLVVDRVLGMQHFPVGSFVNELPGSYSVTKDYLNGGYTSEKGTWGLFSLHKLASDPRFLNVAS